MLSEDLRELYQEVILDHQANPRNFRKLDDATHSAEGYNALCGDQITLFLKLNGDTIADASFCGSGCAISTASASLMTEMLRGKTLGEAELLFTDFQDLATGAIPTDTERVGKLKVLAGVREFPGRVKCATLPWHTFHAALQQQDELVTTD